MLNFFLFILIVVIFIFVLRLAIKRATVSTNQPPDEDEIEHDEVEDEVEVIETKSHPDEGEISEADILDLINGNNGFEIELPNSPVRIVYIDKDRKITIRDILISRVCKSENYNGCYIIGYCFHANASRTFTAKNVKKAWVNENPINIFEYIYIEYMNSPFKRAIEFITSKMDEIVVLNYIAQFGGTFTKKKKEAIAAYLLENENFVDESILLKKLSDIRPDSKTFNSSLRRITKKKQNPSFLDAATVIAGQDAVKLKLIELLK